MDEISVGGERFTYEQVHDREQRRRFMLVVTAETDAAEARTHTLALDAESGAAVTESLVADRLRDWKQAHPGASIARWDVYERAPCASGIRDGGSGDSGPAAADSEWADRGSQVSEDASDPDFSGVSFDAGDRVEFYPAGASTSSVYGPETGEVVDIAPGTDDGYCLVVETDSGTTKIREDWIIEDG